MGETRGGETREMSCKTLKTKWGQEIDISQFENQGYGAFKDFVKNTLDSSWGKEKDGKLKTYNVTATTSATVYKTIEVEAEDEQEALQKAEKIVRQDGDCGWEISDVENYTADYDFDIEDDE